MWCALIRNIAAAGMSLTEELVLKRSKAKSLEAVRNLNCWGCGLSDVSILARMPNLEVLNISCNNLASLKDLRSCHKLTELYIRRNQLSDFGELDHLTSLPNLIVVWVSGNPLSSEPGYRRKVIRKLQQIKKLDNIVVTEEEHDSQEDEEEEVRGDVLRSKDSSAVLEAVLLLLPRLRGDQLKTVKVKVQQLLSQE